jgi:hypothetical protein
MKRTISETFAASDSDAFGTICANVFLREDNKQADTNFELFGFGRGRSEALDVTGEQIAVEKESFGVNRITLVSAAVEDRSRYIEQRLTNKRPNLHKNRNSDRDRKSNRPKLRPS